MSAAAIFSNNGSTPTLCAEEDNVNIPMAIAKGRQLVIVQRRGKLHAEVGDARVKLQELRERGPHLLQAARADSAGAAVRIGERGLDARRQVG